MILMKAYVASHLKDMNRRNIYKMLCHTGETSKSEISRLTGISAPTVIKVISFLSERGLVEELGGGESALGRKPQMLRIKKDRYYSIGIIHEGDYLKLGITNLMNEIISLKKIQVERKFEEVMGSALFSLINEALVESEIRLSDVLGIGLGIPGIYNVEEQTIDMAPLIGITEKTDISHIISSMENKYKLPVFVDNDLNMEVQGEFVSRKLGEGDDLVYLSVGTGIGSGIILEGKLRRGRHYMCGEVGYMTFLDDYVADKSTAGWLESKINLKALSDKFGDGILGNIDGDYKDIAIEYVSICVALCVNNMMMCYDSDNFSIGGEMFNLLGSGLYDAISEKVKRLAVCDTQIAMKSSSEPGIIGAAGVAAEAAMTKILEE